MLENQYQYEFREAGCDEAGRGCLAGPVFAAAVILPPDFHDPLLNDSKQMTERTMMETRARFSVMYLPNKKQWQAARKRLSN